MALVANKVLAFPTIFKLLDFFAHLRDFIIRDELPPGLRCIDALFGVWNVPPYDAAGFMPGGIVGFWIDQGWARKGMVH